MSKSVRKKLRLELETSENRIQSDIGYAKGRITSPSPSASLPSEYPNFKENLPLLILSSTSTITRGTGTSGEMQPRKYDHDHLGTRSLKDTVGDMSCSHPHPRPLPLTENFLHQIGNSVTSYQAMQTPSRVSSLIATARIEGAQELQPAPKMKLDGNSPPSTNRQSTNGFQLNAYWPFKVEERTRSPSPSPTSVNIKLELNSNFSEIDVGERKMLEDIQNQPSRSSHSHVQPVPKLNPGLVDYSSSSEDESLEEDINKPLQIKSEPLEPSVNISNSSSSESLTPFMFIGCGEAKGHIASPAADNIALSSSTIIGETGANDEIQLKEEVAETSRSSTNGSINLELTSISVVEEKEMMLPDIQNQSSRIHVQPVPTSIKLNPGLVDYSPSPSSEGEDESVEEDNISMPLVLQIKTEPLEPSVNISNSNSSMQVEVESAVSISAHPVATDVELTTDESTSNPPLNECEWLHQNPYSSSVTAFLRNMKNQNHELEFTCNYCTKLIPIVEKDQHMLLHLGTFEVVVNKNENGIEILKSPNPTADKMSSTITKLATHEKGALKIKEFKCPDPNCGREFTTKANLKQHFTKIHDKPNRDLDLTRHQIVHERRERGDPDHGVMREDSNSKFHSTLTSVSLLRGTVELKIKEAEGVKLPVSDVSNKVYLKIKCPQKPQENPFKEFLSSGSNFKDFVFLLPKTQEREKEKEKSEISLSLSKDLDLQLVEERKSPFQCSKCPKVFTSKKTRNWHEKVFHDETTIGCSDCGKRFQHKRSLTSHRNSVHQGVHKCKEPQCEKSFTLKCRLTAHVNTVHLKLNASKCPECDHIHRSN